MRAVQLIQVLLLLLLGGYLLLVALENPLLVRLPLPFSSGEAVVPAGLVLGAALLAGGLYTALLFLPGYVLLGVQRRRDQRLRVQAETRLQATLQAVMGQAMSGQNGDEAGADAGQPVSPAGGAA